MFPSMEIVPEFMSSSPAIILRIVDFPQPLGPTRTENDWLLILRDRSWMT